MATPVTPFHPGELLAQQRAQLEAPPKGNAIRDFMPDQHRAFFALLPFLAVATTDREGWPVATLLTGPPGFASSPDPHTLRIAATPQAADPASSLLVAGAPIGVLGIELPTRCFRCRAAVLFYRGRADRGTHLAKLLDLFVNLAPEKFGMMSDVYRTRGESLPNLQACSCCTSRSAAKASSKRPSDLKTCPTRGFTAA